MEIILVSHGRMALGIKDTLDMITGDTSKVTAYAAYLDGDETSYINSVKMKIANHQDEQIVIVTDVLGGSVNTNMMQLLKKNHNVQIIAGMNLPLVMELSAMEHDLSSDSVSALIDSARKSIVDINYLCKAQDNDEEDLE